MCEHHIIAISETWLQSGLNDAELIDTNYNLYRKDRNLEVLNVTRGGGVLLAVRSYLNSTVLDLSIFEDALPALDIVGVSVAGDGGVLYVFAVYFQPNTSVEHFRVFFDVFESLTFLYGRDIILLGDFNIHFSDSPAETCPKLQLLNDFLAFFDFKQYNRIQNQNNTILDLVITNLPSEVFTTFPFVKEDGYHPTLLIIPDLPMKPHSNFPSTVQAKNYNFSKANYPHLYNLILTTNWDFLEGMKDVNAAVEAFYNKLYELFDQSIPLYKQYKNDKKCSYPSWYTSEIISNIKEKSRNFKRWKINRSPESYGAFKTLRAVIKQQLDSAYKTYIIAAQDSLRAEPREFWKYIQQKQNRSRIPGTLRNSDNTPLDNPTDIVNSFANFFQGVYIVSSPGNVSYECGNSISLETFDTEDVLKALKFTKNRKTAGPDKIPSFLIRDCAFVLAEPLTRLFNLSISTQTFPGVWKQAKICPIFKTGNRDIIENYRPVSILSNIAKAFERCIHNKLFFKIKNLITPSQHGFFPGRSTVTNLTCFLEYTYNSIDEGYQVDAVYTDFSKAFDKMDHGIMAEKMSQMGFDNKLIKFFSSYVHQRKQYVEYNGHRSCPFIATSGAPQGSCLAPLIFSIYINDIVTQLKSCSLLFADDLKIFSVVRCKDDCIRLQADLDVISNWCVENRLALNTSKCKKMSYSLKRIELDHPYTINSAILENCEHVKDLGVYLDKKLTFNIHIDEVSRGALKSLGFLLRSTEGFNSPLCLTALYMSLVKSKINYASQIWSPIHQVHIRRLENVQRKFLKYLSFKLDGVFPERGYNHLRLLQRFDLLSIEQTHRLHSLSFLYKLCNGHADCASLLARLNFSAPLVRTRNQNTFYLSNVRTCLAGKAPLYRACTDFNDVESLASVDIFGDSLRQFRNVLVGQMKNPNIL